MRQGFEIAVVTVVLTVAVIAGTAACVRLFHLAGI